MAIDFKGAVNRIKKAYKEAEQKTGKKAVSTKPVQSKPMPTEKDFYTPNRLKKPKQPAEPTTGLLGKWVKAAESFVKNDFDSMFTPEKLLEHPAVESLNKTVLTGQKATPRDMVQQMDLVRKMQAGFNYDPDAWMGEGVTADDKYAANSILNENYTTGMMDEFFKDASEDDVQYLLDELEKNSANSRGDYQQRVLGDLEYAKKTASGKYTRFAQQDVNALNKQISQNNLKINEAKQNEDALIGSEYVAEADYAMELIDYGADPAATVSGFDMLRKAINYDELEKKYQNSPEALNNAVTERMRQYVAGTYRGTSDLVELEVENERLKKQRDALIQNRDNINQRKHDQGMEDAAWVADDAKKYMDANPYYKYTQETGSYIDGFGNEQFTTTESKPSLMQIIRSPFVVEKEYAQHSESVNDAKTQQDIDYAKLMTAKERRLALAIAQNFGEDSAAAYFERLKEDELYARDMEEAVTNAEQFADEHGVLGTAASFATRFIGNIASGGAAISGATDPNDPRYQFSNITEATRDTVGGNIAEATQWANIGGVNPFQYLYGVGTSVGDNVFTRALTGFASAPADLMMFLGALDDGYKESYERTGDVGTAKLVGGIVGALESALEHISWDKLGAVDDLSDGAAKYIGTQALTEAGEEGFTTLGNILAQLGLERSESEIIQKYKDYTRNGYSSGEAIKKIAVETVRDIGLDALAGGISGAALSGGNAIRMGAQQSAETKATGQDIIDTGNAAELIRRGLESADKGIRKLAERIASKIGDDGLLNRDAETQAELAVIAEELGAAQQTANEAQGKLDEAVADVESAPADMSTAFKSSLEADVQDAQGEVDAANQQVEEIKGKQAETEAKANADMRAIQEALSKGGKAIGNLYTKLMKAIDVEIEGKSRTDIVNGIKKRLGELGEKNISDEIAGAIADSVAGKRLKKAQQDILEAATYSKQVIRELAASMVSTRAGGNLAGKSITDETKGLIAERDRLGMAPKEKILVKTEAGEEEAAPEATTQMPIAAGGETSIAAEDGTEKPVTVAEFTEEDGQIVAVVEADGQQQTVSMDSLMAGDDIEATLYTRAASLGNAEAANTMLKNYDTAQDVDDYTYAFQNAFNYGKAGISKNLVKGNYGITALTSEQFEAAYAAGSGQRAATPMPSMPTRRGGRFTIAADLRGNMGGLTANQRAGMNSLRRIADLGIVNIEVFESKADESGSYAAYENGSYDPATNTMRIDINSGKNNVGDLASYALLRTASHELTHFIKANNAQGYTALQDFVVGQLTAKGNMTFDALVAEKQLAQPDLSYEAAVEEVVADGCEMMLRDSTAVQRLAKENRSLFNRIRNWIRNFTASVKRAFQGVSASSEEAKLIKDMEGLQKIWDDALVKAGQNVMQGAEQDMSGVDINEGGDIAYVADPAVMHSLRSYNKSDYVQERDKAAAAMAKKMGITVERAKAYIDDVTSISAMVAADRDRLDFEAEEEYSAMKHNSEYKFTMDFSTLCKKRLLYTGTFDAIQKQLGDTALTEDDYIQLRQMMADRGYEVACAFCYVESRRKNNGQIIDKFLDTYKEAQKNGKKMELGPSNRRKAFDTEEGFTPKISDFNTSEGIANIMHNHRSVYDAYMYFMNARGVSKPKLIESRTDYRSEILSKFRSASAVRAMNRRGGLRLQSFSDFEVVNMLDMMQVVMDMSRVGLMSQAYTKVPAFARVFGGTGVKINLSLVTKGVDSNGKLIFDDVEGMPHAEAFKIREMYSDHVGTILVGKDDATIRAAMADPRIDFIIPYHASGWSVENQNALGIGGYTNFTAGQNETSATTGKTVKNFQPSQYWDYSKTGDENAQVYLEMCREAGKVPKFPQYQNYPGYWKMLIDFKMYNNEGVGSPQRAVHPDFNLDEARTIMDSYTGGHQNLPVARDVVADFVAQYKQKDGGVKFSKRVVNGKSVVWVDNNIFANRKPGQSDTDVVLDFLTDHIGDVYTIIESGQKVYLGKELPGEYTYSQYTQRLWKNRQALGKAKNRMASGIGEAIEIATNRRWEKTKHPHNKDAKYGMYRYDSKIAFPTYNTDGSMAAVHAYDIELVVRNASDKKKYLYDVVNIKKDATTANSLYSKAGGGRASASQQRSNPSSVIVPQPTPVVKKSLRTTNLSDREILADAFESVAQNDNERSFLQKYRNQIDDLYKNQERLSEIREEIRQMMFSTGERDNAYKTRLAFLKNQANMMAEFINRADKRLLGFESAKPLQDVLARERRKIEAQSAEKRQESITKLRDRREATEIRHKIKAVLDDFNRRLKSPTEKKYIPAGMVNAVIAAEELINTDFWEGRNPNTESSIRAAANAKTRIAAIKAIYDRYKGDAQFDYAYDQVISDMLQHLEDVVGDKTIYQLGKAELTDVYDVLKALKKQVTEAVKLKAGEYAATIFDAGQQMIEETLEAAPLSKAEAVNDLLNWQLTPDKFFARLGGYKKNSVWSKVAETFAKGTEKMYEIQRDHYYHFKEFTESKDFDKLSDRKKLVDIGLVDKDGKPVLITRGMMLSVYMHLSSEDNARGFMYGGFSVPSLAKYYTGNMGDAYGRGSINSRGTAAELAEIAEQLRNPDLTDEQREKLNQQYEDAVAKGEAQLDAMRADIEQKMTDWEKNLIKAVHAWNDGKSQQYINDVTMDLYGIKKANVKNYYPIHRDTAFIKTDFESISKNVNLENWGSLKDRVKSQAPILLTDIAFEMDNGLNQMSRYVGYARAQRDFNKLYNVRIPGMRGSVKKVVSTKFGSGAKKLGVTGAQYLENYIGDITGSRQSSGSLVGGIRRNLVRSTMTLNLRVGFSQLSAIPKAAAEVGWDNMAKGFFNGGIKAMVSKKAREELAQQNVWFWQRYRGEGGQREFADAKSGSNVIDRVYNKVADSKVGRWLFNWCQNFDVMSTVTMWSMAKEWAKKNTSYAEGSAEFNEAANKKYTEIIRNTQAMSTTSERSDLARTTAEGYSLLTMFKSEAFANFNLLYDGVAKWRKYSADLKAGKNGVTKQDLNQAKRQVAGAATSVVIGASLGNAVLKLAINALMHAMNGYRDDEDEVTLQSTLTAIGNEVASDMAGMMVFGGELYELISAAVMGEKYYAPSDMALAEIAQALETVVKVAQDEDRTAGDVFNAGKKLAFNITSMLGIPAENAKRYWDGAAAWADEWKNDTPWYMFEGGYGRSSSTNYNRLTKAALAGDDAKWDMVVAELEAEGKDIKDARSGFRSNLQEMYISGEVDLEKTLSLLKKYGDQDDEEANEQVKKWDYNIETGMKHGNMKEDFIEGKFDRETAIEYLKEYDLKEEEKAIETVAKWEYERDTKRSYSDIRDDYLEGDVSEADLRKYLASVEGLNEKEVDERVDKYEYYEYTGKSTTQPKYWKLAYTYQTGGDYKAYADQLFDEIMSETGSNGKKKSWKQARSSIASSLAGYYKKDYLAVKGTPAGDKMLEEILDVYEAIGYPRSYERDYIEKKWKPDEDE